MKVLDMMVTMASVEMPIAIRTWMLKINTNDYVKSHSFQYFGPSGLRALSRNYVSTINVFSSSISLLSLSPAHTFLPEGVIVGF